MNQNASKPPKNQADSSPNEQGSIIIWIFIFVALFAALSFTVSQGSRTGGENLSREKATLAASEILDYATALKRNIHELQINGCSDTEISFENAFISGYSNTNSPADNSCHIFDLNGGGLKYIEFSIDNFDTTYSAQSDYQENVFSGNVAVEGVGTTAQDLVLIIPYLRESICTEINNKMGVGSTMPVDIYTATKFTGSYSASANPGIGDDDTLLEDKLAFCARREAATWHYFGQVLIAR